MKKEATTIALTGNPIPVNSTIFNILTGSRQHVVYSPGLTVEQNMGPVILDVHLFQ